MGNLAVEDENFDNFILASIDLDSVFWIMQMQLTGPNVSTVTPESYDYRLKVLRFQNVHGLNA